MKNDKDRELGGPIDQLMKASGQQWRDEFLLSDANVSSTARHDLVGDLIPLDELSARRRRSAWIPALLVASVVAIVIGIVSVRDSGRQASDLAVDPSSGADSPATSACGETASPLNGVTVRLADYDLGAGTPDPHATLLITAIEAQVQVVDARFATLTTDGKVASYHKTTESVDGFVSSPIKRGETLTMLAKGTGTTCPGNDVGISGSQHLILLAVQDSRLVVMDAGPSSSYQ